MPFAVPVGNGVYRIDTEYLRPGLAASHLVVDDGHAAFVDTGAAPAHPRLMHALTELGLAPDQVDYVFLTHVHLDHAGGAGQLMRALPRARAVLHPRGAPHMVDPAKLIAGTVAVYGEAMYRELYGEIVPIAADAGDRKRRRSNRSSAPGPSSCSTPPGTRVITTVRTTSITTTSSAATPSASHTATSTPPPARSYSRPRPRYSSTRRRCTRRWTGSWRGGRGGWCSRISDRSATSSG